MEDDPPPPPSAPSTSVVEDEIHLKPSIFELLAEEQLRDLLHPVVRYVLSHLAQNYPRYFLRVLNYHEEFFGFLLLLIERHHLKKHNASLSEHFYQLRTVPESSLPSQGSTTQVKNRNISRKQRWGLLFFLVGLPYVRARAQDYFDRLGGPSDQSDDDRENTAQIQNPNRAQRAFKRIYPYLSLSWDLYILAYDIGYLFEKTKYFRPWHRFLGLVVQRKGPDDYPGLPSKGLMAKLPPLLPPLLLLLKLSQWWYSPLSPRTLSTPSQSSHSNVHGKILPPRPLQILPYSGLLPLTPPPSPPLTQERDEPVLEQYSLVKKDTKQRLEKAGSGMKYEIDVKEYGKCPICTRKWQNPAVLPSGWVVCWRCGWDAIQGDEDQNDETLKNEEMKNAIEGEEDILIDGSVEVSGKERKKRGGKCPFTGISVTTDQLRRVLV